MTEERSPKEKYPSVDLVYEFAVQSYDIAIKRFDAVDGRFQTLMSLAVTLFLAVPIVAKTTDTDLEGFWLALIGATFLIAMVVGLYGRLTGSLIVVNPMSFFKNNLFQPKWEFKKDFIYWSGIHYQRNANLIQRKWYLTVVMSFLLFVQGAWVALWLYCL